jgi:hypothetical protein
MTSLKQVFTARSLAVAAMLACIMSPAGAAPITLDFEGVGDQVQVGDYYGGGSGPDLGFTFSPEVIALEEFMVLPGGGTSGSGDIENQPSGETVIYLLFDAGETPDDIVNTDPANEASGILDFAEGFVGAFSFFYSASTATQIIPTVTLFDGLGGTGTALLSFSLALNWRGPDSDPCDATNGEYCNWDLVERTVSSIARSIVFTGATNRIGFDDITINPVPLPAGVWLLISGLFGFAALRRRRQAL